MPLTKVAGKNWESEVASHNGVVLVDFSAIWCGPCKMLAPRLEELATETPGVKFCEVDVDAERALADRMGVKSVPTLVLFKDGKEVDRSVGYAPTAQLKGWISKARS
jgi:thioredoxin 1